MDKCTTMYHGSLKCGASSRVALRDLSPDLTNAFASQENGKSVLQQRDIRVDRI